MSKRQPYSVQPLAWAIAQDRMISDVLGINPAFSCRDSERTDSDGLYHRHGSNPVSQPELPLQSGRVTPTDTSAPLRCPMCHSTAWGCVEGNLYGCDKCGHSISLAMQKAVATGNITGKAESHLPRQPTFAIVDACNMEPRRH